VLKHIFRKGGHHAAHKPNDPVRVTTRPSTFNDVRAIHHASHQIPVSTAGSELLEIGSQGGKTKDTGTALTRTLGGHESGDPRGLGDSTRRGGQSNNDANTHGGAGSGQWTRGIWRCELMGSEPGSSVPTDEHSCQIGVHASHFENIDNWHPKLDFEDARR
jgi:hypothetical protein